MKKEIISESRLREIISEEAARFKKKLTLEAEKKKLLKKLNEMYMEEDMMDEDVMDEDVMDESENLNELFEFKKAKNDFYATHKAEIEAMMKAYKANDLSYVELSKALFTKAVNEYKALGAKYGIDPKDVVNVLYKDLVKMVQPMDYDTFSRQAKQGGASIKDVVGGASAGRQGWTAGE